MQCVSECELPVFQDYKCINPFCRRRCGLRSVHCIHDCWFSVVQYGMVLFVDNTRCFCVLVVGKLTGQIIIYISVLILKHVRRSFHVSYSVFMCMYSIKYVVI